MPRVYKRALGSRRYGDYTQESLKTCLEAIRNGMSTRVAAETYNIPRRTIMNKLKNLHTNKPGYPATFTNEEERAFVSCIHQMSEFGFPVTEMELRQISRIFLNKKGRRIPRFKDNLPGKDWVKAFLKRHKDLTVRFATNIKRSRAALNRQQMQEYIENLKQTLEGVPPHAIFNYDETNLTDNPGQKKVLTKRGMKYPERIVNSSKSCISLMIAGNAVGEVLPPYVVYKSKHLWDTWTENGPPGTRYANTASGWFESETFSDWFFQLLLPKLKKIEGKKVIIGDNLSSHLNVDVLAACKDNDVQFVCLPPNSTHVTQPLDVAFFAPLKKAWREILSDYKESHVGSRSSVLEKQHFPTLLRRLMEKISENSASNLIAGFRKCGIVPCDLSPLLERLHNNHNSVINQENIPAIENSFLESLENKRREATQFQVRGKKKKITVPAGKSIAHSEIDSADLPGTSGIVIQNSKNSKKKRGNEENSDKLPEFSDSDDEVDEIQDIEEEIEFTKKLESGYFAKSAVEKIQELGLKEIQKVVGEYVVVLYDGNPYPGVITEIEGEMVKINAMVKSLKSWKWPEKTDEIWYNWDDILGAINAPKQITKRGLYSVPECDRFGWN